MLGIPAAIFNLILVFIAFGLCQLLWRHFQAPWKAFSLIKKLKFVVITILFILFLPNIAYLFTDARHIADYCDFDFLHRCVNHPWMNLGYFVYGALGIPFFLICIRRFSQLLAIVFDARLRHLVPIVMLFLSALGVRIGLIERFNSWNIINEPLNIVVTSWQHVIGGDPALYSFFGVLTVLYYWSWWWLDQCVDKK